MSEPVRPLRADAARNRELLMAAAEEEFAQRGPESSVADIARRAGVGKGTVFRHFATKEDLIAAIVLQHLEPLDAAAQRLLTADDAGAALLEFLTVAADQRQQHDVSFLLGASENHTSVIELRDRLFGAVTALTDRAREQGKVRPDVTGADIWVLICAPVHVVSFLPNPSPDQWRRYLAIIFDGLRPEGAHPLPQPAPTLT
ncbi:TetR/AcrR family transcriptional regulator [Kineosporia sp. NBRC 101731]|uniref:TetR/AcrR family transcriptional regulator n=1 Tax=Kineosporia sp. NBRC 101731 TaxID=3032199 RepID=UPI0024A0FCEE|nr:TetR/AcrR family transcriptional regulator [Kineosporia sp. NBRC 101731]GLY29519.1 TetR family transcriptional regulator [Kineosporia sp. NBRC 101731]